MKTASVLLLFIGLLGAFDVAWFHTRKARLLWRDECRREAWIHVARGVVYAVQFAVVPGVRLDGAWALALFSLFAIDAAIALLDVLSEPASRRAQGGLPAGEYAMHVVLSVLVGAMLHAALGAAYAALSRPTALVIEPQAPWPLRAALLAMALVCAVVAFLDAATLIERALPRPAPVHVAVRLPATLEAVWALTQDHVRHPEWDHRFDRIVMLADRVETGTRMRYEKRVLGMTIRGWGRYKLHKPMRQSTFEFGSDDPRSLIVRGVGLWLYEACADGRVSFRTSYTYEVRWGLLGRWFDRLVFRPLFQRETERSFRRLAERHLGVRAPRVVGAAGRKPAPFVEAA